LSFLLWQIAARLSDRAFLVDHADCHFPLGSYFCNFANVSQLPLPCPSAVKSSPGTLLFEQQLYHWKHVTWHLSYEVYLPTGARQTITSASPCSTPLSIGQSFSAAAIQSNRTGPQTWTSDSGAPLCASLLLKYFNKARS
jgi:hypothetical protein